MASATQAEGDRGRQLRAAAGRGDAVAVEELLGAGAPVDAGAEEAEATALLSAGLVKGQNSDARGALRPRPGGGAAVGSGGSG